MTSTGSEFFITKIECESNFISIGGAYQQFKSMNMNEYCCVCYSDEMILATCIMSKERKICVQIIYMSTGGVYTQ